MFSFFFYSGEWNTSRFCGNTVPSRNKILCCTKQTNPKTSRKIEAWAYGRLMKIYKRRKGRLKAGIMKRLQKLSVFWRHGYIFLNYIPPSVPYLAYD